MSLALVEGTNTFFMMTEMMWIALFSGREIWR